MMNVDIPFILDKFYEAGYITSAEARSLSEKDARKYFFIIATAVDGREIHFYKNTKYSSLRVYTAQGKFDFEIEYWYESDEFCIVE